MESIRRNSELEDLDNKISNMLSDDKSEEFEAS